MPSTNGRASIVTRKANGVAGWWRDVRAGCQGRGRLRGQGVECSVTALFIQRLNSLRGEAGKCQHGEDDYEEYRSSPLPWKEKAPSSSSQPAAHSQRPAPIDARRGEGGTLCHTHSSLSLTAVGLCWRCICFTSIQIKLTKEPSKASAVLTQQPRK